MTLLQDVITSCGIPTGKMYRCVVHVYKLIILNNVTLREWHAQEFCLGVGGFQQIQLRTEDRDLGVVAPWSGVLEAAVISYKKFHFI